MCSPAVLHMAELLLSWDDFELTSPVLQNEGLMSSQLFERNTARTLSLEMLPSLPSVSILLQRLTV